MEDAMIQLTDKEILKASMKQRRMTQVTLAEKLGIRQNSLSANMSRDRMSLSSFAKILDALGYDVLIRDRESGELVCQLEVESER